LLSSCSHVFVRRGDDDDDGVDVLAPVLLLLLMDREFIVIDVSVWNCFWINGCFSWGILLLFVAIGEEGGHMAIAF